MSIIDNITELMLRQGDIAAQQAREKVAEQEEQRRNKHRILKGTLKALAMFGPYFIPGAGIIPAIGGMNPAIGQIGAGIGAAASRRGMGNDTDILLDPRY